ncbi:MAG: hypothetical protein PHN57_07055 [Candidatus Omnitrophica bacterium]|nr:hypothetical protein [Candidatus Omnitrophota bacterium]
MRNIRLLKLLFIVFSLVSLLQLIGCETEEWGEGEHRGHGEHFEEQGGEHFHGGYFR